MSGLGVVVGQEIHLTRDNRVFVLVGRVGQKARSLGRQLGIVGERLSQADGHGLLDRWR